MIFYTACIFPKIIKILPYRSCPRSLPNEEYQIYVIIQNKQFKKYFAYYSSFIEVYKENECSLMDDNHF